MNTDDRFQQESEPPPPPPEEVPLPEDPPEHFIEDTITPTLPPLPPSPPPLPPSPPPPVSGSSSSSQGRDGKRRKRKRTTRNEDDGDGDIILNTGKEEQVMMAKMMGFSNFDSTKGKQVPGNQVGAVHVVKKRRYRQYMNRKGGFNRPLDKVA